MLKLEGVMEIRILHKQGLSIRAIARQLGVSRNTVREYLRSDKPPAYSPREKRSSKLDPYKPYIQERVQSARPNWIPGTVIDREIRALGYPGSIRLVRYRAQTKGKVERFIRYLRYSFYVPLVGVCQHSCRLDLRSLI